MQKTKVAILILAAIFSWGSTKTFGKAVMDFDGDGRTDPTAFTFTPDGRLMWYTLGSSQGYQAFHWGANTGGSYAFTDVRVPEDYDGDGKWDYAVWRRHVSEQGQSYFFIYYSSTNTYETIPWGLYLDQPICQDYDGDGKADIAVARAQPDGMTWYIIQSRDGLRIEKWGNGSERVIRGDYDGDGKADLAVYRQDTSTPRGDYTFFIKRSSDGGWIVEKFGYAQADYVISGDFDGDGKNDIAVWRGRSEYGNGTWYWHRSSDGAFGGARWGLTDPTDIAVQGDYDGDGKTDPAVWRQGGGACQAPTNPSYFWIMGSSDGIKAIPWGNVCFGVMPPF